ncbi:MAG: succinate dehydrogenase cytochrome b subunit [Leptolyngbyaceae cyanobacterium]
MHNTASSPALLKFYASPIGKKLLTGFTGLGLAFFATVHMVGNLLMFVSHEAYNTYAYYLERWILLLWLVEMMLAITFLVHAIAGLQIFWRRRRARPEGYAVYASRGEPSLQSISSRTMIVTGSVLLTFLIIHLVNFKFGTYYLTAVQGEPSRDLARLVIEKFQRPVYAFSYTGVMVLLGVHLRHGLWSALQSLGLLTKAVRWGIYGLSLVLGVAIALGFVVLPLAIYFQLLT